MAASFSSEHYPSRCPTTIPAGFAFDPIPSSLGDVQEGDATGVMFVPRYQSCCSCPIPLGGPFSARKAVAILNCSKSPQELQQRNAYAFITSHSTKDFGLAWSSTRGGCCPSRSASAKTFEPWMERSRYSGHSAPNPKRKHAKLIMNTRRDDHREGSAC
jgi:hypothetical protein